MTSSKAVSTRTSVRRTDARNERETRSPSSGSTPRSTGDHHSIVPSRPADGSAGIGNSPRR